MCNACSVVPVQEDSTRKLESWQQRVSASESELTQLNQDIETLQQRQKNQTGTMQVEVQKLETQLEDSQSQINKLEQTLMDKSSSLLVAVHEKDLCTIKLEAALNDNDTCMKKLELQQQACDKLKLDLKSLEQSLEQSNAEAIDFKTKLSSVGDSLVSSRMCGCC
jgi:chromosome segregation ATPase